MKGHFVVNVARIRRRIGESVTQRAERVTQTLVNGFIEASPVWGGNFRAAWNVSQGAPVYKYVDGGTPQAVLPPPNIVVKANSHFPVFYITNGQPYAKLLEYGWSHSQAPYGVVRITIASLR